MNHWGRWLPFNQHLFVPKHVTLSQKIRLAWLVSISLALFTSSEVLSCAHWADVSLDMLEKCHQPMFRLQKGLEGPSHVSPGIPGRVESLCWLLALNDQEDTFLSKKSSVTSVISRDQRRSNTSCFLACCLVDFFLMNITASVIFYRSCAALQGRLVRKGTKSCLGQEMKADIRSSASFPKPRAPGLSCTDPRFHRSMQQHAFLWCISESLDRVLVLGRNHCTGLSIATVMIHCELVPILILVSIEDDKEPLAFSSSWQNL